MQKRRSMPTIESIRADPLLRDVALRPCGDGRTSGREDAMARAVTLAEIMSRPVITIEADATLAHARHVLTTHAVHHLLVYDRGRFVGVLSDRDLLRHLSPFVGTIGELERDAFTLRRPVFHAATYRPLTLRADATVEEAAVLLLDHGISALPVVDAGGEVLGLVTSRDLLRGIVQCPLPEPR